MSFGNMADLYPAPFPEGVAIAEIETISLQKLLDNDIEEMDRIFEICKGTGFFYLDMMDHEKGRRLWQDACIAARSGMEVFPNTPLEIKKQFKAPSGINVLDKGYRVGSVHEDGTPKDSEMFMIPQYELLGNPNSGYQLPSYLVQHEDRFKNALRSGNVIANIVLGALEKRLELPSGSFTRLHKLTDSSGDFLRVIRYPGAQVVERVDPLRFPAHKDAVSIAILFTWLGGLQITAPEAEGKGFNQMMIPDEYWRWIKPVPGTAIVNLGDAMEVFTNKLLKSGLHRVVKAPGEQVAHDKYSVLIVARPEDSTPMRPFKSPLIPERAEGQFKEPVPTSIQWGHDKINALQDFIDDMQSRRAGKEDKLERSW